MPTATSLPRCPHRVATSTNYWLPLLVATLVGSTTATESLNGQELDYRFVVPTSHMQPWPDDEPVASHLTLPTKPPRVAVKWRTKLVKPRAEKPKAEMPPVEIETKTEQESTTLTVEEKTTTTVDEKIVAKTIVSQTPVVADKLPEPTLEVSASREAEESAEESAETLIVSPEPVENSINTQPTQPTTESRRCYQAPPLSSMSASIALPAGKLPTDAAHECALQNPPNGDSRLVGAWGGTEHHWSATCMRHRPLYFEEINAERYGYTVSYALQPAISAARFFATIPALPYKMVVERPRDCIYTLGHYRPGSCAPRRWNRLPLKLSASAVETGFIAAMILIIP